MTTVAQTVKKRAEASPPRVFGRFGASTGEILNLWIGGRLQAPGIFCPQWFLNRHLAGRRVWLRQERINYGFLSGDKTEVVLTQRDRVWVPRFFEVKRSTVYMLHKICPDELLPSGDPADGVGAVHLLIWPA